MRSNSERIRAKHSWLLDDDAPAGTCPLALRHLSGAIPALHASPHPILPRGPPSRSDGDQTARTIKFDCRYGDRTGDCRCRRSHAEDKCEDRGCVSCETWRSVHCARHVHVRPAYFGSDRTGSGTNSDIRKLAWTCRVRRSGPCCRASTCAALRQLRQSWVMSTHAGWPRATVQVPQ
jgi:hypothetical protein